MMSIAERLPPIEDVQRAIEHSLDANDAKAVTAIMTLANLAQEYAAEEL